LEHELRKNSKLQSIKAVDIDLAIQMLKKYLDTQAIQPLVSALETLKSEPQNVAFQTQVIHAFNGLNQLQGAALTYAPYLNIFVSDDPFGD
jgi:uridine kinase